MMELSILYLFSAAILILLGVITYLGLQIKELKKHID